MRPLAWPVPGGYISQYFHYGHPAIDIAAPYGSRIVAAAAGTVIFAGWKDNGGGYQVWISPRQQPLHDLQPHVGDRGVRRASMSGAASRSAGSGMTGNATGPHCHFEVWIGPIWDGGHARQPAAYF